jgi:hypothetical protein
VSLDHVALARKASPKQWVEAQLEKGIKELMRKAEILHAQEHRRQGKGKLGSICPRSCEHAKGLARDWQTAGPSRPGRPRADCRTERAAVEGRVRRSQSPTRATAHVSAQAKKGVQSVIPFSVGTHIHSAWIDGCNSIQRRSRQVDRANCDHSAKPEPSNQSADAVATQQCVKIDHVFATAPQTARAADCG